ncbi:hypothetical protein EZV61_05750 [Corallincola luteus]|uniref:Uncharacterized protein n=1 Tax=Corallincola luteus TaxID=1775177 RepID=A0ABY2ATA4_9GAMM|nr:MULTISPECIES: hypothetical protein [Corallincola]TCI05452.1 hypothetical protein EZV61_05750 [Corallincola luteus]
MLDTRDQQRAVPGRSPCVPAADAAKCHVGWPKVRHYSLAESSQISAEAKLADDNQHYHQC